MGEAHEYRSPLLGDPLSLSMRDGVVEAFSRGEGPPIVFTHGWLANANLWRKVVDQLASRFRCIALDLPFGAHRVPMDPTAQLSSEGCAELILDALDVLELDDVTLVGNDSGGAYCQIALSLRPERAARLVLTSCETPYDAFPPEPFDGLPAVARDPQMLGQLLSAMEDPEIRKLPAAFGLLVKHPLELAISDSYALPAVRHPGVLSDVAKVMAGASTEAVRLAGEKLIANRRQPVLLVWSHEDPVFPIGHARRYADALADARLVEVDDCYSFTPEDQPTAVAEALSAFIEATQLTLDQPF